MLIRSGLRPREQMPGHGPILGSRSAFALLEILVVIAIIALLVSVFLVAGGAVRARSEIRQTRAMLELLDSVIEEYYLETGEYFEHQGSDKVTTAAEFLDAILGTEGDGGIGNIGKMLGALRNATWTSEAPGTRKIYDAWGEELIFNNSAGRKVRPWFQSKGPDGERDSDDDLFSAGGRP